MKTYKIIFRNSKTGLPQGTTVWARDTQDAQLKVKAIYNVAEILELWEV
jgi:hypothetical protein